MPAFRKLSDKEVDELTRRRTNTSELGEYIEYLKSLKEGDWGSIALAADETQRTVKRRTSLAATSIGKKVRWKAGRGHQDDLVFQVSVDK